jgi:hypothetical protein
MTIVTLPTAQGNRYRTTLLGYIVSIFEYLPVTIKYSNKLIHASSHYECLIDGKPFMFNLSDLPDMVHNPHNHIVLKRTLLEDRSDEGIFPLGPLFSATNYQYLLNLRKENVPEPINEYLYSQRIYGNATQTRGNLKRKINYTKVTEQKRYWKNARTYKYNIFLPGSNKDVLDRAPSELMFLGCTIMHPKINILFPHFKRLEADIHYIEISHSGEDALDKMMGDTGKEVMEFYEMAKPENLFKWWTSL